MATKKTGLSRDLIIHPGETIADLLEDRNISQAELAVRTGVSPAYICNVISGKKDISARFAQALEYAFDVPKSFWLNLQANYDAELLEYNALNTITNEEREARNKIKDVIIYLHKEKLIPASQSIDESILSIRKALGISDLSNLNRIASKNDQGDPYSSGAWQLIRER